MLNLIIYYSTRHQHTSLALPISLSLFSTQNFSYIILFTLLYFTFLFSFICFTLFTFIFKINKIKI